MAAVADSVGTTARDFSTITLHEASLSAHSGDTVTASIYNDSVFDELITLNDSTPDAIIYTVPLAERNDGTEGTGSRIVPTSAGDILTIPAGISKTYTIEWLEINCNAQQAGAAITAIKSETTTIKQIIQNMIIHNMNNNHHSGAIVMSRGDVFNNFIYDIKCVGTGTQHAFGIQANGGQAMRVMNNTLLSIINNSGTGKSEGFRTVDGANKEYQNNIILDVGGTASGSQVCYDIASFSNATVDHNMASDTTASGTGSLDSQTSSDVLTNVSGGSEDLHLKLTGNAFEAGTDLGAVANVDIDNRDRDSEGDTWSMGAHQGIASGTILPILMNSYKRRRI